MFHLENAIKRLVKMAGGWRRTSEHEAAAAMHLFSSKMWVV